MNAIHPHATDLENFVLGKLAIEENLEVVQHLLTGCEACRETTADLWRRVEDGLRAARRSAPPEGGESAPSYDDAVDRAFSTAMERASHLNRERSEAANLVDELSRHPVARQLTLVNNSRRFRSWALCEQLIAASFERRFDDPHQGVGLAEVALAVARRVPDESYGVELRRDLEARAWAYLGNARRVASDLAGAGEAFGEAQSRLREGTGDPLEKALLLRFKAHLFVARRRFDVALGLYDQALQMYRRFGEKHRAAMVTLDKGFAFVIAEEPARAIPLLRAGLEVIDHGSEPQRVLAARHNLIDCLNETGRPGEALRRLGELRPFYRKLGDRMNLVRLRWLEGKILVRLERAGEAEEALLEARDSFIELGVGYETALVSLDLAALYAESGRTTEVLPLCEEMIPIFESRGVAREALAALITLQTAARREHVTVSLIREIVISMKTGRLA